MRVLFLDHATIYGGRQVMAERLLPLLRARGLDIDSLVGCERLEGDPIPTTFRGLRRAMAGYDLVYANSPRTAIAAATTQRPFLWHKHDVRSHRPGRSRAPGVRRRCPGTPGRPGG